MRATLWIALLTLVAACSAEARTGEPGTFVPIDGGAGAFDSSTNPGTNPGNPPFMPPGNDGCEAISERAETAAAPVDIVWIIDNSGSMGEERDLIQTNLNSFAETIERAGLDVRVVLITQTGFAEIPPPLGTSPDKFLRVSANVQSHNSFQRLLDTLPEWQTFLRRESALNLIVTTDDSSDMISSEFLNAMTGALARSFRFHAIASPPEESMGGFPFGGCSGPHGRAPGSGQQYWDASLSTGGRQFSICTSNWDPLFAELSQAIAVPLPLPCSFAIPEPPPGTSFDPGQVNVEYFNSRNNQLEIIPFVREAARCGETGWYYDTSNPGAGESLTLCPAACARVEGDTAGQINIAFGCETLVI